MMPRGMLFALVVLAACAGQNANAEELRALRGAPDTPLHTNAYTPPGRSAFGAVEYFTWKNNCVRIPPVVAGRTLDIPEETYAHVAPYSASPQPATSFMHALLQSFDPDAAKTKTLAHPLPSPVSAGGGRELPLRRER